jgi:acetyl esterase
LPKGRGADVREVRDLTLDGPNGPVPARRYTPHGDYVGRIVYFHGGGWVFGTLDGFDPVCRELAAATRSEVVSVDYRLAPEHPYPAPLDDAFAAVRALAEDGVPLAVAGDSAGGNLAAACALRARDEGGPVLRFQLLMYPVLDPDFDSGSYRDYGQGDYFISRADMEWFWTHHAGDARRDDPLLAPARAADLSDLPEAIVVVAGCDPLRDEGLAYAAALRAAGVPVTLEDHDDMAHGFCTLIDLLPRANETVQRVGRIAGDLLRA